MKKFIFVLSLLGLGLSALSQQASEPRLKAGIALGMNQSAYAAKFGRKESLADIKEYTRALSSLRAEAGLWVRLKPWLNLRTGTTWETKGVWITEPFYGIDWQGIYTEIESARMEYSYFTIPLMLEFGFGQKVRFYGGGGIYGGVKYRGAIRESGQRPMDVYLISFYPNDRNGVNWFDWGINGNAGVSVSLGPCDVFLETRISRGMKKLLNFSNEASLHHLAYSVQTGVNFPLNLSKKPPYERFN